MSIVDEDEMLVCRATCIPGRHLFRNVRCHQCDQVYAMFEGFVAVWTVDHEPKGFVMCSLACADLGFELADG
jgi:hypothetical protein